VVFVIRKISTPNAPSAIGPYSQAVIYENLLFTSGQIPLDPKTMQVVEGGIKEQTLQVMKNIEAILKEANSGFDKVIKTTCFLKNMSDFSEFNEVYKKFFVTKPARSCVAVKELPKDVLVEVEVIAIL